MRLDALHDLERVGDEEAIPAVRQVWLSDPSPEVRARAASVLAVLGDSEAIETLISTLRDRAIAVKEAKAALATLGESGDVRGVPEILQAVIESWAGPLPGEALSFVGIAALEPVIALVMARPELAQRKSLQSCVLGLTSSRETSRILQKRLDETLDAGAADRAAALLKLTADSEPLREALAARILTRLGASSDKAEKALAKAAQQALKKSAKAPEASV